MPNKIPVRQTFAQSYRTIWKSASALLTFTLLFGLTVTIIIRPLLRGVLALAMYFKGYPVLVNADISHFFKSIVGIVILVLIGIIACVAVYFEFSTILHLLKMSRQPKAKGITLGMTLSFFSLSSLKNGQGVGFLLFAVILMPFVDIGPQSSIVPQIDIPNFIAGEISKHSFGPFALIALGVSVLYLFFRLFFVLPIMIFEGKPFFTACRKSFSLTKGNTLRICVLSFVVILLGVLILLIPTILFTSLRGLLLLPLRAAFFIIIMIVSSLVSSLMLSLMLCCYESIVPPFAISNDALAVQKMDSFLRGLSKNALKFIVILWQRGKKWLNKHAPAWLAKRPYLLLILLLVPVILLTDIIIPLSSKERGLAIIGHRGSLSGVENTTEAIEGAIAQGADFAEIDVLLSADNVPMVIHDYKLQRLTGKPLLLYELTAEELGELTLSNRGYQGKISSLDEICRMSKGRIKLLIEYKSHGHEQASLVQKTVETVRAHDMVAEVEYQTLERPLFQEMRLLYPEYTTGFIVYGHIGSLTSRKIRRMNADFLGVEEGQVTSQLVKAAHRAGVPLYVWTVNNTEDVAYYVDLQVDAIITDYPGDVRDSLTEDSAQETDPSEVLLRALTALVS